MHWLAVASREHVRRGITGGFAQVCHGKPGPLKQMSPGDWLVYYSPTEFFCEKIPCRKFTAIGRVKPREPYQFQMSSEFIPWRRDIEFMESNETSILPLIDSLSFIQNKQRWGFPFRRGCFGISSNDFQIIASSMGIMIQ